MSGSVWAVLEVERTTDGRAIRAAYARKLRTIDMEAEPQAFTALRAAYEQALHYAARAQAQPVEAAPPPEAEPVMAPAEDAPYRDDARWEAAEPEPAAPPPPPAERPSWVADIEAINALIGGDQSREAIFAPITTHINAILSHPAMLEIDHAAQVENWAAHTILNGMPRTNALLNPCIAAFGWWERAAEYNCPPAIGQIIQRHIDNQALIKLREANSVYSQALQMLCDPANRPRQSQLPTIEVLLNRIRTDHPTLILELDPQSLARWEAMIERNHNRPAARVNRWMDSNVRRFVAWCQRYRMDVAFKAMGFVVAAIILLGLAIVLPPVGIGLGIGLGRAFFASGRRRY